MVLLLDVDDDGALGVILNRPSPVAVAEVLDPWAEACDQPEVLFQGGPVSADGALAVARVADDAPSLEGFRPIGAGAIGLLDLERSPADFGPALVGLRIFAGYAGWGAQQLADEIEEGAWHVVPGSIDDAFCEDTTTLRRDVLKRQPGELAWLATRPADPSAN